MTDYLSSHAIAKLIHASPSAVLNWIDDGLLPAYRTPGGHRRVERAALIKFLRDHEMPVPPSLCGLGLLIIDEDKKFLRKAKRLIKKHAPTMIVETTENVLDALFQIGFFRPDVVLVDASMTTLICERLKKNPETKNIGVIALSHKMSATEEASILKQSGITALLSKPLDARALLSALGLAAT